ncbi:tripartite tricarboxylate transporter substrate binding protein [Bordetella sp. 15P40C-2]|uniref:Bug family tripartite tricarboxylate transporter substrate binding protein n=1 Tax=Bordetella sp. 15P40C-2 TaxID=2572246 RepID=UPI00132081CD|nr:tripartite tricarboxylate transporter substrate binding protein [Bordetella sp. 15P40C-2]MVW70670.1 tripartite tricarboxylate transporter substrate binding protein [Bordetella sp. 15P40C-2]
MNQRLARYVQALTITLSAAVSSMAIAAEFPAGPVTVVVPYSPGGGVDTVARIITQNMAKALGQPIVVENRPGAATNIGMTYVARAQPDGYTLYAASNTITTNKALYADLPFEPMQAFKAVGKIGEAPLVVVVNSTSPHQTLDDLVKYGRSHPGELTYGTAGVGSSGHMASELFARAADFKALHVPYKGGTPAVTDLLAGRLSFMAINPIEVVAHVQSGKLRPLAVLNDDGTHLLPDLKTAKEQGVNVESTVWWGLVAPAGTPDDVTQKLHTALQTTLRDPEVIDAMKKRGAAVQPGSSEAFKTFMDHETTSLSQIIKEAGIKAE